MKPAIIACVAAALMLAVGSARADGDDRAPVAKAADDGLAPDDYAPPQCDRFDGADYTACVNRMRAEKSKPKPVAFRPWQEVWQCNDLRVTVATIKTGAPPAASRRKTVI